MRKLLILALALMLLGSPAHAAVICEGYVTQIVLTPEGDFYVNLGQGSMKVCVSGANTSVNKGPNYGGSTITPTQCEVLYSAFASAHASGRKVQALVDSTTCNGLFNVGVPNPYPYIFYFPNSQ
jgi:hypothetical protein